MAAFNKENPTVTVDSPSTKGSSFATVDNATYVQEMDSSLSQSDLNKDLAIQAAVDALAAQQAAETAQQGAESAESSVAASASAAAISASDAANSATSASSSATAASISASSASTSATSASNSATSASSSASAAEASRIAAESAQGFAELANVSSLSAQEDAEDARDAAIVAQGLSENARDASIVAQGLSEGARDASIAAQGLSEDARDAAIVAQTAAEAAQSSTQTLFDQFGDRYLGSHANDAAVATYATANGYTLDEGDSYWNSTENVLEFYTGTDWVAPEDVATTAATNASNSATAAANSASAAASSSTTASGFADDASDYADAADLSAQAAAQSATDALAAATDFYNSEAYSITATDTSNWDTAFGWGDHSVEGYTVDGTDVTFSSVQLTGGTGTQGTFSWNTDEETVDVVLNGATLQLGQEVHYHVRNNTASAIPNGTAVYATGTLGASGRITIAPFIADGTIPAKYFIGITTEEIAAGTDGKVTDFGKVRHLDTNAYNEGDVLYPSSTVAGGLTNVAPTSPALAIPCAFVVYSGNNGNIFVRVHPQDENAYATYAQGALADSAVQPGDNVSTLTNDAGYLTSYTETDPVFTAWDKSTGISITESQISDFGSYATVDDATALAIALG